MNIKEGEVYKSSIAGSYFKIVKTYEKDNLVLVQSLETGNHFYFDLEKVRKKFVEVPKIKKLLLNFKGGDKYEKS